jgi:hypothetical protein
VVFCESFWDFAALHQQTAVESSPRILSSAAKDMTLIAVLVAAVLFWTAKAEVGRPSYSRMMSLRGSTMASGSKPVAKGRSFQVSSKVELSTTVFFNGRDCDEGGSGAKTTIEVCNVSLQLPEKEAVIEFTTLNATRDNLWPLTDDSGVEFCTVSPRQVSSVEIASSDHRSPSSTSSVRLDLLVVMALWLAATWLTVSGGGGDWRALDVAQVVPAIKSLATRAFSWTTVAWTALGGLMHWARHGDTLQKETVRSWLTRAMHRMVLVELANQIFRRIWSGIELFFTWSTSVFLGPLIFGHGCGLQNIWLWLRSQCEQQADWCNRQWMESVATIAVRAVKRQGRRLVRTALQSPLLAQLATTLVDWSRIAIYNHAQWLYNMPR